MKIAIKQFLSPNHSWGRCGTSIARCLIQKGHEVHLCSTNGYDNFPKDLENNIVCKNCIISDNEEKDDRIYNNCQLNNDYDMVLSYTRLMNFYQNLSFSKKYRFGIWNYDGTEIPKGYCKHYKAATNVLPSSQFSKDVFIKNGIPEEAMIVVPHGYDDEYINRNDVYPIKTDRKRKFLVNIQQNHVRKNIPGILDAWGKAFTNNDDVVMIAKVNCKGAKNKFEVSWLSEMNKMKKKYKNHAPILIVNNFIDYMSDIYRACDVVFSASNVECFLLPHLEGLAANKLTIASNWGGNVDFGNSSNSLMINGKVGRAPDGMQYWGNSVYGECFYPDTNHAAELLQLANKDYDLLMKQFQPGIDYVKQKYTWDNVVAQMISLIE